MLKIKDDNMLRCIKAIGIMFVLAVVPPSHAVEFEWQALLEERFDVVSTFDDLNDWGPTVTSRYVDIQRYPEAFPRKTIGGGTSIWQFYSDGEKDIKSHEHSIKSHAPENLWRGEGKSMSIDYRNGEDGISYGPSRMGFKLPAKPEKGWKGNSPSDGYDEVYVFYMTKWFSDFFKHDASGSITYHRFLKTLYISSGFKTVRHWGTDTEHQWVEDKGGGPQVLEMYGLNAQIYNYHHQSNEVEAIKNTVLTTDSDNYYRYSSSNVSYSGASVAAPIKENEWFGIEIRVKKSHPHGTDTGEFEVWIYNTKGEVTSHHLDSKVVNFKDGNTPFDHRWNKFVWGGNRLAESDFGPIDHFYIDDVIIHGKRIGPDYFKLLNVPDTPELIELENNSLKWTAETYATGYRIYYGVSGSEGCGAAVYSKMDAGMDTTYSLELIPLNESVDYCFKVTAYNMVGESGFSNSMLWGPGDNILPQSPIKLRVEQ